MWDRDHMGDGRWGVGWIGIIGMLLVVAATVGLIVWLVMRSPSAALIANRIGIDTTS